MFKEYTIISKFMTEEIDEMFNLSTRIIGAKRVINSNVGSLNPIIVNKSATKTEKMNIAIAT